MVQIYRKKWERGFLSSLLGYLRDSLVLLLPFRRLPDFLVKWLYGFEARFAFVVHPRNYQDIFMALPFLKPLQFLLRKKKVYRYLFRLPPFVVTTVRTGKGVHGLVVGQLTVPETMFARRKEALKLSAKSLRLISKIAARSTIVGLGGWIPIISRRGVELETEGRRLGLVVTNGHSGTLVSIYLTVEKIAKTAHLEVDGLSLAVIGVGKMGSNVAQVFNGKVNRLLLMDINLRNLEKVKALLGRGETRTKVDLIVMNVQDPTRARDALRESHIGICATSAFRNLLRLKDLPDGFIAIDDSRPEALPRDPKLGRIILEGGLLKIEGAKVDYNYGFGQDDNVFGCLGESFLLALDRQKHLKPTLGEVDRENFSRMLEFCRANHVTEGDLKSGEALVSEEDIRQAFEKRKLQWSIHPNS